MLYRAPYLCATLSISVRSFSRPFQLRSYASLITTPHCPAPTCPCAATPPPPVDVYGKVLEINRDLPLKDTLAPFQHQVLLCTGRDDWASRIEDEPAYDGKYRNVAWQLRNHLKSLPHSRRPSVSILNTSLPIANGRPISLGSTPWVTGIILPAFKYIPHISLGPRSDKEATDLRLPAHNFFGSSFNSIVKSEDEVPSTNKPALKVRHDSINAQQLAELYLLPNDSSRHPDPQRMMVSEVEDMLIVICGHGARDARCGLYGPLLRDEFIVALLRAGVDVVSGPEDRGTGVGGIVSRHNKRPRARVALTSHVGGHQFAGTVGIWMPRSWGVYGQQKSNPLGGSGVWYGRVEPKHVEGIVAETVIDGRIIEVLLRGIVEGQAQVP